MALEDKLKEQQAQASELENKVANAPKSTSPFSYITHGAATTASTLFSYSLVGINGPLTGLAFVVGKGILSLFKKAKTSAVDLMDEMTTGSLLGIVGSKLFEYAAKFIPNPTLGTKALRAAAGLVVANPIFVGAYLAIGHFVRHPFDIFGMYRNVRDNLWKMNKETLKYLGIPLALTINGYMGGYPGIVAADAGYRVVFGLKGEEKQKETVNYAQPAYAGAQ